MCFSATASFTAAGILSTIGLLSCLKTHDKAMKKFATTPLFFSLQQACEGFIWLAYQNGKAIDTNISYRLSILGFLFLASIFWPIFVPHVLYQLETKPLRKKILSVSTDIGIMVALLFTYNWLTNGISSHLLHNHLVYPFLIDPFAGSSFALFLQWTIWIGYCWTTLATSFISSIPHMWILGILNGIGLLTAIFFYTNTLGSVWCFFAAVSSIAIYSIVSSSSCSRSKTTSSLSSSSS